MRAGFIKAAISKIFSAAKNHYGALLIALGVGLLYFLQDIILAVLLKTKINLVHFNLEEIFSYGTKVREIIDGHFFDGDPYLAEYKSMVTTWDYYPLALVLGVIARIFGFNDPSPIFIWSDLLLPPVSFLIFYFLILNITGNKWWSAFSSFILIAFTNITQYARIFQPSFYAPFAWEKVSQLILSGFNTGFSRMFVPSLTMIFFSVFLFLLYKTIAYENISKKIPILAGISFGLLFYVYFYYWIFAASAIILAILISLIVKGDNGGNLKKLLFLAGSGLIVSIPHWLRYLFLHKNLFFKDYLDRIGIEFSHRPRFSILTIYVGLAMLALVCLFRKGKIKAPILIYLSSLLLSAIAVSNMQVLLGFSPQPDHWGSRVNAYILILSFAVFFSWVIHRLSKEKQKFVVVVCFFVFGTAGLVAEINYAYSLQYEYVVTSDARAAFAWIDQNTPKDAVFVTPAYNTRVTLPYFTHANVYLPMAPMSLAPENEIVLRYLTVYRLFNIVPELVDSSIKTAYVFGNDLSERERTDTRLSEIESNFSVFGGKFSIYTDLSDKIISENGIKRASQFSELYNTLKAKHISFDDLLWRADYVFWGPAEKLISGFDPAKDAMLSPVYSNSSIQIFKIGRAF